MPAPGGGSPLRSHEGNIETNFFFFLSLLPLFVKMG